MGSAAAFAETGVLLAGAGAGVEWGLHLSGIGAMLIFMLQS